MTPLPVRYIAAASDMDGTLLQPDHKLSEYAKKVIAGLHEKQVTFILATGRPHSDVLVTLRKVGLKGYVVTSNGGRAHDPEKKTVLRRDLDPTLVKELVEMGLEDQWLVTNIYQEDHWYMSKDAADLTEYYQANRSEFYYEIFNPATHPSYEGTYKVYYTADKDHVDRLRVIYDRILERHSDRVSVAFSLPNCVEVTAANVNKGTTLALLLKTLFPSDPRSGEELLQQTISFGDGENDCEMLVMAGKGCVMANAQPELLSKLPKDCDSLERIGSNVEDATAHRLAQEFHVEV